MGCLNHPHFSVMINGSSKGFFPSSRGLRQGDPLSLFLFTLVVDEFSASMSKATENDLIKGFESSRNGLSISHLQFANDTICFVEANMDQVVNLKIISKIFEGILGLKVNIAKLSMTGIGVDGRVLYSFAGNFGCKVEFWLMKYLGMPLGGNLRVMSFWDTVMKRVKKKLASWKRSYFSSWGIITLIKVVMSNVLVYNMSLFRMSEES